MTRRRGETGDILRYKLRHLIRVGSIGSGRKATCLALSFLSLIVGSHLVSGCCSGLPLMKCSTANEITVNWTADENANEGHSVRVRWMLLRNADAFLTCPADDIFDPDSDSSYRAKLGEIEGQNFYPVPAKTDSKTWTLSNIDKTDRKTKLHLGVIAYFSQPASPAAARRIFEVNLNRLPVRIDLKIHNNSLEGSLTRP